MAARKWTQSQRDAQSLITLSIQPWLSSTSAKTNQGKRVIRYNSMKSGYFKESYREFRQNKRSHEARNIEQLIRKAGKTKEDTDFFNLIELIKTKLDDYYDRINQGGLSSHRVSEGIYLSSLICTIINNCAVDRVIEELHKKRGQDACSSFADPTC